MSRMSLRILCCSRHHLYQGTYRKVICIFHLAGQNARANLLAVHRIVKRPRALILASYQGLKFMVQLYFLREYLYTGARPFSCREAS